MKRGSGVLMHISSLPGGFGEGSFGKEAKEFADFLKECGFTYWQVLPFCMPDMYNSPYKSFSAFSGNPNFIDIPTLFEDGLITREEMDTQRQKQPYSCEFPELWEKRYPLYREASRRAFERAELKDKIDSFISQNKQIDNFCRFMAMKDIHGYGEEDTLCMWKFIQYEFFTQWMDVKKYANDLGIQIIGDIPIYVDNDSADVWANPEMFQLDESGRPEVVAGVPPDYFCEDGQLWGNPIYDWDYMKKDGYSWWKERMEYMLTLFDGVRIDHFRAFESYWAVPADAETAKEGKWVKGPGEDFIDCLKEAARDKFIIAEDLGDITDEVRDLVKYSGFPGMRILQFAFLGDPNTPHLPHNYEKISVSYTGTHDNNTLLGYVWEAPEHERRQLLKYCGWYEERLEGSLDSILRVMFGTHSDIFIMPIQDVLQYGGDTRMNKPGSSDGNWSYRVTKEQICGIDKAKYLDMNKTYGRA